MRHNGHPTLYNIANFNIYFSTYREKQVNPGAETDKAKFLVLLHLVALLYIVTDTTGKGSGDLAHQQFHLIIAQYHGGTFVLCGRLWMPCYKVFTGMVFHILHLAGYRAAVH